MRTLEMSGAGRDDREGKEKCKGPVARLSMGGEQTVRRAPSLCHWETRRRMGGRQDSIARIPIGVDEEQLVAHHPISWSFFLFFL